jgi:small subunit ribosomal protein S15
VRIDIPISVYTRAEEYTLKFQRSLSHRAQCPIAYHRHPQRRIRTQATRPSHQTKNLARRLELAQKAATARPHVVLGTISNTDTWTSCDLARTLVQPDELAAPLASSFGIRAREQRMLFAHLPLLAADMHTRREMRMSGTPKAAEMAAQHERALEAGTRQAESLAKLVDLRNANAAGVAFENRRRVVEAFSEPGKPGDTGRTEVQGASFRTSTFGGPTDNCFAAALLTLQIRKLWDHLSEFKRDVANRRNLRRLVHQRAKLLKYLKRTNRDRYERVLERLGLAPGAVEGELVI